MIGISWDPRPPPPPPHKCIILLYFPNNDSICRSHTGCFYGDPHVVTLDKYTFTFNGLGEYFLVVMDDFTLQGRTGKAMKDGVVQEASGTVFIGLAAQMGITNVCVNRSDCIIIVLILLE